MMSTGEMLAAGSFGIVIIGNVGLMAMGYGSLKSDSRNMRDDVGEIKEALSAKGEDAFVKRGDVSRALAVADAAHDRHDEDIRDLRDATRDHETRITHHDGRLSALERH